jgi:hypothetical protein
LPASAETQSRKLGRMLADVHLLRITCAGCDAVWAGADRAHCASCHSTFDDLELYDRHRDSEQCVRPQRLGLVTTRNGIWRRRIGGEPRSLPV